MLPRINGMLANVKRPGERRFVIWCNNYIIILKVVEEKNITSVLCEKTEQ